MDNNDHQHIEPQSGSQPHHKHSQSCSHNQINQHQKGTNNQPEKKPMVLYTLGVEPFIFDQNQQDANFISCRLGDIAPNTLISNNIKSLLLRNNLISKIQGLENLKNLVELELYDNKILKIEGLEELTNLQTLDLSYNNIKKIENISHLKNIKKLYLLSNKIKKIQNLEFPVLEMLELGSNKIRQIQNLQGVSSIRSLFLGKNRISEIKNLQKLVNLQQIALGPNKLTSINEGLLPLRNTLKELYLQENQIEAMTNLNELKKLQILDISYNKVEHLRNIDQLTQLECLYLNGNKISEYEEIFALKANSKLNTISLFGNDVTKEPGYRMKLLQLLPEIDDIDGTPMKTSYKIVYGSNKSVESSSKSLQQP